MATEQLRPGFGWMLPTRVGGVTAASGWAVPATALLLWPAFWNGYPIVFADTGTYLSQAVHLYAGWDRPVFYSLFILPLHATLSLWPVIVAQALIALYVLRLLCRILLPGTPLGWQTIGVAVCAASTWLPFLVSEIMPDLFTPLLAVLVMVLAWAPDRIGARERWLLAGLAASMTTTQQSSVPVVVVLTVLLAPLALGLRRLRPALFLPAALVPLLATLALCSMNLAAHHRFALSPYGVVFYLARLQADGPAVAELRRSCPGTAWRLCDYVDRLPIPSDAFLWRPDSPLNQAGGPKQIAHEASAIITGALRHDPAGVAESAGSAALRQILRFDSGDGLEPWAAQVTPWIVRDFPAAEAGRYARALQQDGRLTLPAWLVRIHKAVALAGVVACLVLLPGALRQRSVSTGFLAGALLLLPLSAAVTGALSTPHDRYQSRVIWLPAYVAVLTAVSARRRIA